MIPMIELYLKSLISSGIKIIRSNPDIIDNVFSLLGPAETSQFKRYMTKQDIKVTLGFPRNDPAVLPCICILLGTEDENVEAIGDFEESIFDEEDEIATDIFGTMMRPNYRIECWSDNMEVVLLLYGLTKFILLSQRDKLMKETGLMLPRLGGGDLEPLVEYFPAFVYRRGISLSGQLENTFIGGSALSIIGVDVGTDVCSPDEEDDNFIEPGKTQIILNNGST